MKVILPFSMPVGESTEHFTETKLKIESASASLSSLFKLIKLAAYGVEMVSDEEASGFPSAVIDAMDICNSINGAISEATTGIEVSK